VDDFEVPAFVDLGDLEGINADRPIPLGLKPDKICNYPWLVEILGLDCVEEEKPTLLALLSKGKS
jgi:hypothetical protein